MKMSDEKIQEVLRQKGLRSVGKETIQPDSERSFRAAQDPAPPRRGEAEAASPRIEVLQRKYGGEARRGVDQEPENLSLTAAVRRGAARSGDVADAIVIAEPVDGPAPIAPKAKVLSEDDIIGEQG